MLLSPRFLQLAAILVLCLIQPGCGGGGGGGGTAGAAAPTISNFTAASATIASGASTTLTGTFSNGTGTVNPGGLSATSGLPLTVSPAATTTYTLTVLGAGGSASASTTVTVVAPPRIDSFTADPTQSWSGQTVQLRPTFSGGTGKIGTGGPGSSQVSANAASGAALPVMPSEATTYTLTVTNALGAVMAQDVQVAVETRPSSISSFAATQSMVDFGTPVGLAWALDGIPSTLTLNGASVLGQNGATVTPVHRSTYTLVARNPLGPEATATLQVAARGMDVLAGDPGGFGDGDGQGSSARFGNIRMFMVVDGQGNLFLTDISNATVRKITPGGLVSTVAGRSGAGGYADGPAASAKFNFPTGIAVDGAGNLYVCDSSNTLLRKITPGGVVSTLAGQLNTPGSADGLGPAARFSNNMRGLVVDGAGVLYLADGVNRTIRKILPDGTVSTLAGLAGAQGATDGTGSEARFQFPVGLTLDGTGNLFVTDSNNHTLRKIVLSNGLVSTLAGTAGASGSVDGTGSAARFYYPNGLAFAPDGFLYVADSNNSRIRKINPATGEVSTLTGTVEGYRNGPLSSALLSYPTVLASAPNGALYLSESGHGSVRKIQDGQVSAFAGVPVFTGHVDGPLREARFASPSALVLDGQGVLSVAQGLTLRSIRGGGVSTLAGDRNGPGTADGAGSVARFRDLALTTNLGVDGDGNLYVPEYYAHTIRKVTPQGVVSTLAGQGDSSGAVNGVGNAARFSYPRGAVVGLDGNLYVADDGNSVIRRVTPAGEVTVYAGAFGVQGEVDGNLATARFNGIRGISRDGAGNLVVTTNTKIRKITPGGQVTTLAGNDNFGDADGTGPSAGFYIPTSLAVDGSGNVFVLDWGNGLIRKVTPAGVVTTVAGTRGKRGMVPGGLPGSLWNSGGLAVTPQGDLLVSTLAGIWQITAP